MQTNCKHKPTRYASDCDRRYRCRQKMTQDSYTSNFDRCDGPSTRYLPRHRRRQKTTPIVSRCTNLDTKDGWPSELSLSTVMCLCKEHLQWRQRVGQSTEGILRTIVSNRVTGRQRTGDSRLVTVHINTGHSEPLNKGEGTPTDMNFTWNNYH